MQKKLIIFVLTVFVGMQFGVSFCSQEQSQPQSWSNWLSGKAGSAWRGVKSAPRKVLESAKGNLSESWDRSKKETDFVSPSRAAYKAANATALSAYVLLDPAYRSLLGSSLSWLISPEVIMSIDSLSAGKIKLAASAVAATSFVFTYVLEKSVASYRAQDITKEKAVSDIKDAIRLILSDSMAYPTRSSKINALLKKNEFLGVDMKDEDGILAQACSDLIEDASRVPYDKKRDEDIDKAISKLNVDLLVFGSLGERINYVKNLPLGESFCQNATFGSLMAILNEPAIRAQMSVMLRLQKQLLFEFANSSLSQSDLRGEIAKNYNEQLKIEEKYSAPGKVLGGKMKMTPGERANYLKRLKEKRTERAAAKEAAQTVAGE